MKYISKKTVGRCLPLALAAALSTQALAADAPANIDTQVNADTNIITTLNTNAPTDIPSALQGVTDWIALTATSGELITGHYYLTGDTTLTGENLSIAENATVTIYLNGHQLKGVEEYAGINGSVITVNENATLNLYDNEANAGTITGGIGQESQYNDERYGGGIYVNGTLNMYGGNITNNAVNTNGGGIYVSGGANFTMEDGKITNNKADQSGGGVYVTSADFTMVKGEISNNTANYNNNDNGDGGGIYLSSPNSVTINTDGTKTISNNFANYGGGIFLSGDDDDDNFTISNLTLYNNTATVDGGGLYVESVPTFEIKNSTIENNTATTRNGGGIYTDCDNVTIYYITLSGNKSTNGNGGGAYITGSKTLNMPGAQMLSNTAKNGGGIYVNNGTTVTMNTNTISDNTATENGGGIYAAVESLTMSDGIIEKNEATEVGGGLCVKKSEIMMGNNNCTFGMTNVTVGGDTKTDGNSANDGGGIYIYQTDMTTSGSTIKNNEAQRNGGGISVYDSTFTMDTGNITNNISADQGGGVYYNSGTLNFQGTVDVTGNTSNGEANNVELNTNTITSVTGNLHADSKIGFTQIGTTGIDNPIVKIANEATATANNFQSDSDIYKLTYNEIDKEYYLDIENISSLFAGGEGTIGNPYQIATAQHLDNLSKFSENTLFNDSDKYYQLTDNIELNTDYKFFNMKSNLDGNDKTISGTSTTGIFEQLAKNATLKNIKVDLNFQNIGTTEYFGSLVHEADSSSAITNCHNLSNVTITNNGVTVGGLVGTSKGKIENCSNQGNITGQKNVGGIAGMHYTCVQDDIIVGIINCYNTGNITSTEQEDVPIWGAGGIVGIRNVGGNITGCYNTGKISSKTYAGGIMAANTIKEDAITDCYNTGEVDGKYAGGVIGLNTNTYATEQKLNFSKCYNTGKVSATEIAGGVVGKNQGNEINNCFNVGEVSSKTVGGVVGENKEITPDTEAFQSTITNTYNVGKLTGTTVGGIAGSDDKTGTFTNCYYLGEDDNTQVGKALTLAQMTGEAAKTNMSGFNFSNVWYINPMSAPIFTENYINGISVNTLPKTTYTPGSKFDPTGLVLNVETPSGSGTVNYTDDNKDDFAFDPTLETSLELDTTEVKITYKNDYTTTQTITVRTQSSSGSSNKPETTTDTQVKPNISTNGSTTNATVNDKDLKNALDNAVEKTDKTQTPQVEITVPKSDKIDSVQVEISKDAMNNLADKNADLTVNSGLVDVKLPAETIESIINQGDTEKITIHVEKIDNKILSREQQTVVKDTPVYDVYIKSGDKKISTFNGKNIEISIPYELAKDENAEHIVIWYLSENGKIEALEGAYDAKTKQAKFSTKHLSYYVALHHNNPFEDVAVADYFFSPIMWAVEEEITTGTTKTTFSPNETCTRGQAVTLLYNTLDGTVDNPINQFVDLDEDMYYMDAVLWAASKAITTGTSATTFSPNDECTRAQIVTFLWKAAGKPVVNYAMNFEDVSQDAWYAEAIRWAVSEGITTGTDDNKFSPNAKCTRAQIMTFLYRKQIQ